MKLHELEALANEICEDHSTKAAKLHRLIRAYARIINIREPQRFPRKPLEYADENGHWDSSYPPEQEYRNRSGPRLLHIIREETQDVATSGGYYYSWRRITQDPGLLVAPDGGLYGSTETGTGEVGQYAAYPGDRNVMVEITYDELALDDVPIDRLEKAERELRALAFPLVAARQKEAQNETVQR